jgi:predicted ArsR family transcriptional regulator
MYNYLMKPTTRLRILDHFRKYQTASVKELSVLLNMTGANVRHHLSVLESSDLIEVVALRNEGRGRPANVYGLSRRMLGDGMDKLSAALLDVWLVHATKDAREEGLKAVAGRLAGDWEGETLHLMKRLAGTIDRLNALHYQARWEASPAGPRIILGHCPYHAIISDHPELCRLDSLLLQAFLKIPVEHTVKLQLNDKNMPFCAFLVMNK